jgi:hypothetical protein
VSSSPQYSYSRMKAATTPAAVSRSLRWLYTARGTACFWFATAHLSSCGTRSPARCSRAMRPCSTSSSKGLAVCVGPAPGLRAVDATTFRNPGATGALHRCGYDGREYSRTT